MLCVASDRTTLGQATDSARRLRGVIDKDETWSGTVLITDDVTIDGATVTVEPGTIVEFACAAPGRHPVLIVGTFGRPTLPGGAAVDADLRDDSPRTLDARSGLTGGYLVLNATVAAPIVFRTRPNTSPGRIVVNARNRIQAVTSRPVGATNRQRPSIQPIETRETPDRVAWRHVRLLGLGYAESRPIGESARSPVLPRNISLSKPALTINAVGGAHSVEVEDCVFDAGARLAIKAADGTSVRVAANRFENVIERICLDVSSTDQKLAARGPASVAVASNRCAAGVRVGTAPAEISGNLLIGPEAALIIQTVATPAVSLRENYIHCTAPQDDGHYALNCENPDARIEDNVIRGGTACVLNGSRQMAGNVVIGAPSLKSTVTKSARTHQLVAALPAGSVFADNLLLGPAYSLLAPQPTLAPRDAGSETMATTIRNNLFDGFATNARAIALVRPAALAGPIRVENNVFLRLSTLVSNEADREASLDFLDFNAFAPAPARPLDRVTVTGRAHGEPGWSAHDIERTSPGDLGLPAPPERVPDFDDDLLDGRATIAAIRQRLCQTYRLAETSPLLSAGRQSDNAGNAARPSIGPACLRS